ncbi:Na+/H+ antiporter subunit E [Dehalobacterium formicoaceticum]|uniref:Na+/H+ antiporter subunit E n=1 Tax=Dehalobacterium formicoaceticum TaxID=51515 RepID=UPI000B7C5D47|nr:Na+/H+ antiporter subunit E [Dehalobacterium formicoaceticum]
MPIQLLLNIFIAVLWVLLQDSWTSLTFFVGYLVGLLLIFLMRRYFPTPFYLKKLCAMIHLLYVFIRELVSSAIFVLRIVLSPKININPGFFTLETQLRGSWELTTLSLLITLTPGSVVIGISPEEDHLFIHAVDIPDMRDAVIKAKDAFEHAIMGVTR